MRLVVLALSLVASTAALAEPPCTINREQFETIKNDWPISKVNNFLGCVGELTTESKFGDIETQVRKYPAANGRGVASLMFQNRRLMQKYQSGL